MTTQEKQFITGVRQLTAQDLTALTFMMQILKAGTEEERHTLNAVIEWMQKAEREQIATALAMMDCHHSITQIATAFAV